MGRPSWACDKKWNFLQLWKEKYLVARKEKKLKQFWPAFFAAYHELWPKPGLHEAVQPTPDDTAIDQEDKDTEEVLPGTEPTTTGPLAVSDGASQDADKPVVARTVAKPILTLERVSNF